MSDRPLIRALQHVWRTLQAMEIPAAVMGGIALAAWRHLRHTQDVDLLIGIGNADPESIVQKLRAAGIRPKRDPAVIKVDDAQFIQLIYEPPDTFLDLQVDLLLAESPYQLEALTRRQPARFPDSQMDFEVLSCEDLIVHKLAAGRVIDRADAAALLRINQESLDLDYLVRWADKLSLRSELCEIWDEAFPGKSPPALGGE